MWREARGLRAPRKRQRQASKGLTGPRSRRKADAAAGRRAEAGGNLPHTDLCRTAESTHAKRQAQSSQQTLRVRPSSSFSFPSPPLSPLLKKFRTGEENPFASKSASAELELESWCVNSLSQQSSN